MKSIFFFLRNNKFSIFFFCILFIFSYWLMFSTFGYENGNILVASKAWSDFGSHIPLIRSFSMGWNFPPEYPLFTGEPIRYHFLFYAFVGFLERIGLPIDLALNFPSAVLFFLLLVAIYAFAKALFKSRFVGALSVLFFLLNGSFSFLYFFKENSLSIDSIRIITESTKFVSFNPYYGDSLVSAFWNLNIYTNQRHLAAAFAFSLILLLLFLRPVLKNRNSNSISIPFILGISLGLSFYFHLAAFGMTGIIILLLSMLFKKLRGGGIIVLATAGILALPQYLYMNQQAGAFSLIFKVGYLTPSPVTLSSFINYWVLNLGLHFLLIPIGFILAPKTVKKICIAFFAFFVIGNVFQFSPEMAANHKFFNYFMLIGGMLSAYAIYILWKKNVFLKPLAGIITFFLILSGVIDIFPIYNDTKVNLPDYPQNKDVAWILKNTSPNSVFLNTTYFVPPESLAGRRVLYGWPYFAWSQGYDTKKRGEYVAQVLSQSDVREFCILSVNTFRYLRTSSTPDGDFPPTNPQLLMSLTPAYTNPQSGIAIYDLQQNCP